MLTATEIGSTDVVAIAILDRASVLQPRLPMIHPRTNGLQYLIVVNC